LIEGIFFFLTGKILVRVEKELVPGFGSLPSARWSMFLLIVSPGTNIPNHIWRKRVKSGRLICCEYLNT